jgi:hypothetical protein
MVEIRTSSVEREKWVKTTVMKYSGDVVFLLAVDQYDQKPSKKQAIAIYEIFCSGEATAPGECKYPVGDIDADASYMGTIKGIIDVYKRDRGIAKAQNALVRYFTTSDRAQAVAAIFASVVRNVSLGKKGDGHNSPLEGHFMDVRPAGDDPHARAAALKMKALLKGAGFNTSGLGLNWVPGA